MADLSRSFLNTLFWARAMAIQSGSSKIRPEDLVLGIFGEPELDNEQKSVRISLRLPTTYSEDLAKRIGRPIVPGRTEAAPAGDVPLSAESGALVQDAFALAEERGDEEIGPLHLLSVILNKNEYLGEAIRDAGLDSTAIESAHGAG